MGVPLTEIPRPLARELAVFVAAVFVGSLSGLVMAELLGRWTVASTATNVALAVATTCTGATHSRLAHRQPLRSLLPRVAVALPLAYGVMRMVHLLLAA
jgi:hypothetical protein